MNDRADRADPASRVETEIETSVVVTVRNGARFVAEAIESVRAQLGQRDEILVVDDGSTDATAAILAPLDDPRLRRFTTPSQGVSAARNRGMEAARGSYLAFLDYDDLWPEGRHATLLGLLKAESEIDVAAGRIEVRFEPDAIDHDMAVLHGKHLASLVGTCLYRKAAIEPLGGFAESMQLGEDAEFHQRLVEAGLRLHFDDCTSLIYRRHGGNITNDKQAVRRSFIDLARRQLARRKARTPDAG